MKTHFIAITVLLSQIYFGRQAPARAGQPPYTAHEWGTFTSVQAADGKLIEWNPLKTSQLPRFVYDRLHPPANCQLTYAQGKGAFVALQRMETPVVYFYSPEDCTVDVTV